MDFFEGCCGPTKTSSANQNADFCTPTKQTAFAQPVFAGTQHTGRTSHDSNRSSGRSQHGHNSSNFVPGYTATPWMNEQEPGETFQDRYKNLGHAARCGVGIAFDEEGSTVTVTDVEEYSAAFGNKDLEIGDMCPSRHTPGPLIFLGSDGINELVEVDGMPIQDKVKGHLDVLIRGQEQTIVRLGFKKKTSGPSSCDYRR